MYYWAEFEVNRPHTTALFDVMEVKGLYAADHLEPDELLSVTFEHPNRNTLEYVYIDGTWQDLQRTVIPREHFYLRFFDYDTVTINIDERE